MSRSPKTKRIEISVTSYKALRFIQLRFPESMTLNQTFHKVLYDYLTNVCDKLRLFGSEEHFLEATSILTKLLEEEKP